MEFESLLYDVADHVATVTINRPERRNALSWTVMTELRQAFAAAKADPEVRVVVLTGAGDKAFCAGADLSGMAAGAGFADLHDARGEMARLFRERVGAGQADDRPGAGLRAGRRLRRWPWRATSSSRPTTPQFGTPEIDVGLWPMMITVPMLRSMPPKKALELMMTGRRVAAAEALRIGFVNRVVPVDELDAAVAELTSVLAAKSPAVMKLGRDAFYAVLDLDVGAGPCRLLHAGLTLVTQTEDAAEGLAAFAEKKRPGVEGPLRSSRHGVARPRQRF